MAIKPPRRPPRKPPRKKAVEEEKSVDIDDVLDGKYRLVQRLDEGGMGSVFIGHNEALDVPVAVKVIRSDAQESAKEKLGGRLLQEARAAAQLGHPAIVRMMDFGTAPGGDPYLVMELLDGEDLATALDQRGRVNPAKAVRILMPIVHALAAAHDKGIVHRDLKPDNIILAQTETGRIQPKLIDFGVAKLQERSHKRLTQLGDAVGTPEYMSPQQARGEDVDAKADIWAMAVLLYEMVTGRMPFEGYNYHALLRAIIEDDPEPIGNLGVQADELWAVLERALAKKPEDRWSSMREFGAALAAWLVAQGVTEDICGASLRATWLESGGGRLVSAFDSLPPPSDEETEVPAPVVEIIAEETPSPTSADGEVAVEFDARATESEPPESSPSVVVAPAVENGDTADVVVKTPRPSRRDEGKPRRWSAAALWLLLVGGVVFAVTGYLGVPLPGIPPRLAASPPATAQPASTPPTSAPEPAPLAAPTTAASTAAPAAAPEAGAGGAGGDRAGGDGGRGGSAASEPKPPPRPRRPHRRPRPGSQRYLPSEL